MMRQLLLSAAAIALLGGCMTDGYSYRTDRGDYYYGQPGIDYRYYDSPYGPYSYRGRYDRYYRYGGYGSYYGYPYSPYYGHPFYPYRPPVIVVPRPDPDGHGDDHNDRRPPWRDLDDLRRRQRVDRIPLEPGPVTRATLAPSPTQPPVRPAPDRDERPRAQRSDPRAERVIRRAPAPDRDRDEQ